MIVLITVLHFSVFNKYVFTVLGSNSSFYYTSKNLKSKFVLNITLGKNENNVSIRLFNLKTLEGR